MDAKPTRLMLIAALVSRSCSTQQLRHVYRLTLNGNESTMSWVNSNSKEVFSPWLRMMTSRSLASHTANTNSAPNLRSRSLWTMTSLWTPPLMILSRSCWRPFLWQFIPEPMSVTSFYAQPWDEQ